MSTVYILTVDQGTTSTRAIIFDQSGTPIAQYQLPHRQIYPKPGWVSHDAEEIVANTIEAGRKALLQAHILPDEIAAMGITNQRETIVLWDKNTGKPLCDAIVWQCRRTAEICAEMIENGMSKTVRQKTGLLIDPYFSATKIKWMLDNIPQARTLMDKGDLLAGTMDSYLIWKLTEGKKHITDYTNASRTLLFNIHTLSWDTEMLDYFGIHPSILPEVVPCIGRFAEVSKNIFGKEIPITGIAGDQHASLFGQTCFKPGDVKNTYGTGCFIVKNIGNAPQVTENMLTTMAWYMNGRPTYALEGSVLNAGAAIEWMLNEAKLADSVKEINTLCENTPDTNGACFVPAFSGLGAPYWDMYARGMLCGLVLSTNRAHIVRAVMESIAYRSRDVMDYMAETSGLDLSVLRVDGGICKSDFMMQFQADLMGIDVERPVVIESTAQGVFYMAALGVGLFKNTDEIKMLRKIDRIFKAGKPKKEMDALYFQWRKAVGRVKR